MRRFQDTRCDRLQETEAMVRYLTASCYKVCHARKMKKFADDADTDFMLNNPNDRFCHTMRQRILDGEKMVKYLL